MEFQKWSWKFSWYPQEEFLLMLELLENGSPHCSYSLLGWLDRGCEQDPEQRDGSSLVHTYSPSFPTWNVTDTLKFDEFLLFHNSKTPDLQDSKEINKSNQIYNILLLSNHLNRHKIILIHIYSLLFSSIHDSLLYIYIF